MRGGPCNPKGLYLYTCYKYEKTITTILCLMSEAIPTNTNTSVPEDLEDSSEDEIEDKVKCTYIP
jgi:hypothetical protein